MKGFRTIAFGLLIAILAPAITYLDSLKQIFAQCGIDPTTNTEICGLPGWVGMLIGGLVIVLRLITSTSVFKK